MPVRTIRTLRHIRIAPRRPSPTPPLHANPVRPTLSVQEDSNTVCSFDIEKCPTLITIGCVLCLAHNQHASKEPSLPSSWTCRERERNDMRKSPGEKGGLQSHSFYRRPSSPVHSFTPWRDFVSCLALPLVFFFIILVYYAFTLYVF